MKKLLTFIILALTINVYSQKLNKEYYDWAKTKIKREYYSDTYGTLNGPYKAYSEYGGIMKQGQCKDDGPIGKWIENYDNGKLRYIKIYDTPGTYDFQVKDGKIIAYYEDGKTIKYERNFRNMELDGDWKEYNDKGVLTKEGKYVNGVFEPTGITKKQYEEDQNKEKERQAKIILKNTEEYKKIILEADNAYAANDYKKALELYESASNLLVNEKYPKEKKSEIKQTLEINTNFLNTSIKNQYDSLINDFKIQKADFKIKSIKEYNKYTYAYEDKRPEAVNELNSYYNCDCVEPWNYCAQPCDFQRSSNALECFKKNKKFYEPYQIATTEAFFKYGEALSKEKAKINSSKLCIDHYCEYYTYDKNTFFTNLKESKANYELSTSVRGLYNIAIKQKDQITALNDQNKKKALIKKYIVVYDDLISQINAYPSLTGTISLLKSLNTFSEKVVSLYSQDTKELEKKLKDALTSDQIQALILGQ